jgi:prepilin-type N-terminal cleavage/methylation domain-containing protein
MNRSPQWIGTKDGTMSRGALHLGINRDGFTLIELLVSITILALVMSQAIGDTRKLLNCDDQARLVFTRMDSDFTRMLTRKDVDIIFAKQGGGSTSAGANDAIYFVTEAAGSNTAGVASYFSPTNATANASLLTLAGYCIAPDAQGTQINTLVNSPLNDLNRLGHALTWDTANSSPDNLVFVSFAAPTSNSSTSALIYSTTLAGSATVNGHWGGPTFTSPTIGYAPNYNPPTTSNGDYHAVGDQVFRFEYCFLLKDGTYSNVPAMVSVAPTNLTTGTTSAPTPRDDLSNTSGNGAFSVGSRWFDVADGRAFICLDATTKNAIWGPLGVQDVSALIVAIALLDRDSRQHVTSSTAYNTTLPSKFADSLQATTTAGTTLNNLPVSTGTLSPILMQQNWQTTVDASGFAGTVGLPVSSASHVRVYQRYFYLNANNL